jgi:hypothetical protein
MPNGSLFSLLHGKSSDSRLLLGTVVVVFGLLLTNWDWDR